VRSNVPFELPYQPLKPSRLSEVKDEIFLKHDINLFNFVIDLNKALQDNVKTLTPPEKLDFSAITHGPFLIEPFPPALDESPGRCDSH
jgi:hypothetical protein